MTSASKIEAIIKIVDDYTQQLNLSSSLYAQALSDYYLYSGCTDEEPKKEDFYTEAADTILFRIKSIIDAD